MSSDNPGCWLSGEHFEADTGAVARDLIGRTLRIRGDGREYLALIVETEAYGGSDDPASHAAFRPGGRAALMLEEPGHVYVYAAYGMYPCFNIVAKTRGHAGAVLVRGVWAVRDSRPTFGPGRTSRRLAISLDDHGRRVGDGRFDISVLRVPLRIEQTARIGISRGIERPWRFLAATHEMSAPR